MAVTLRRWELLVLDALYIMSDGGTKDVSGITIASFVYARLNWWDRWTGGRGYIYVVLHKLVAAGILEDYPGVKTEHGQEYNYRVKQVPQ